MHLTEAFELLDALGVPLEKASGALLDALKGGRLELDEHRNLRVIKQDLIP
jgi:hypothetical protein